MNEAQRLHREAMELADGATLAQTTGDAERARDLFRHAFAKELQAAERFVKHFDLEPTRSVLFRSAASLALDCGEYEQAAALITRALDWNPPTTIADDLRDLLQQVNRQRNSKPVCSEEPHLYRSGSGLRKDGQTNP